VVTIITAIVSTIVATFSMVFPVLVVVFTVTVFGPIMRYIHIFVPVILHEVDAPVAGMIIVTIFIPVLDMPWWDT